MSKIGHVSIGDGESGQRAVTRRITRHHAPWLAPKRRYAVSAAGQADSNLQNLDRRPTPDSLLFAIIFGNNYFRNFEFLRLQDYCGRSRRGFWTERGPSWTIRRRFSDNEDTLFTRQARVRFGYGYPLVESIASHLILPIAVLLFLKLPDYMRL